MDAAALLRQMYAQAHSWLEATIGDLNSEQLHWCEAEGALPVAAHYAHIVAGEDFILNMTVRGAQPLLMSSWAGKTGLSELPPMGDWGAWGRTVQMDLPQFQAYAKAVFAETDAYLGSLTGADLDREIDTTPLPFGKTTVGALASIMCSNVLLHTGEISTVKGLQGLKGYPF